MEYYDDVKSTIRDLINKGMEKKDIVNYFKDDIAQKKISTAGVYKFYNEVKEKQMTMWIKEYIEQKETPDEIKYILDFLLEWSKLFRQETREIITNPKIKKKVLVLEPYVKNLEKVYNILNEILPKKVTEGEQRYEESGIPIKMPEEELVE